MKKFAIYRRMVLNNTKMTDKIDSNLDNSYILSDCTKITKEDDKFQRYEFAESIAKAILDIKREESIVFGIYGKWGEGKTIFADYIWDEIPNANNECIKIKFNPWFYTDENKMLLSFFNLIASEFNKNDDSISINKPLKDKDKNVKESLLSTKQKIGKFLKKLGVTISFSIVNLSIDKLGELLDNSDITVIKNRLEDLLKEYKQRVIIIVDDIDRLDKNEIFNLFRIIKLTCDFPYFTYILLFDKDMVASAIGERFGGSDKKAGEYFLEKIIQVPINLPKVSAIALRNIFYDKIKKLLDLNGIVLSENESRRFYHIFEQNILSRISTNRQIILYNNTIAFSLPLLKGEVNVVDLLIIEAIKIFYPEYYTFIKLNPYYFISIYLNILNSINQEKIDEINKNLDKLGKNLSDLDKKNIIEILLHLFPYLNAAFNKGIYNGLENIWYINKNISSVGYFDRFFSYTVLEGDTSDLKYDILINKIINDKNINIDNISIDFINIIKEGSAESFISKLRSHAKEYDWESAKIICKVLCNISDNLSDFGDDMFLVFSSPNYGAVFFIYNVLKNRQESGNDDYIEFVNELIINSKQFEFAYRLHTMFDKDSNNIYHVLSEEQYDKLGYILLNRAINEAGEVTIFEKFPKCTYKLVSIWKFYDEAAFKKSFSLFLNKHPNNVIKIMASFLPEISNNKDLSVKDYKLLVDLFDKKLLLEKILNLYSLDDLQKEPTYWNNAVQVTYSEINMLRQFMYFYNNNGVDLKNSHLLSN